MYVYIFVCLFAKKVLFNLHFLWKERGGRKKSFIPIQEKNFFVNGEREAKKGSVMILFFINGSIVLKRR